MMPGEDFLVGRGAMVFDFLGSFFGKFASESEFQNLRNLVRSLRSDLQMAIREPTGPTLPRNVPAWCEALSGVAMQLGDVAIQVAHRQSMRFR